MANPHPFKPVPVDPRTELNRRLAAAPAQHAEALLVAWDVLQTAHDQGMLDLVHGLVAAKDTVFGTLAEYAKQPEGVAALRNLIAVGKVLGAVDPEALDKLARAFQSAAEPAQEEKPPGLWQIFRRAASQDGRRGLSLLVRVLSTVGRSVK